MKIELYKLYQYVFNDWANVDKYVKADLEAKIRSKAIDKKRLEIRGFFANLINQDKTPVFRNTLRKLKSTYLETILYDNITDPLNDNVDFPTDDQILEKFKFQESNYGYFAEEKNLMEISNKFIMFYKVSKLVADFIELNNNDQRLPDLHAYKMLSIFKDFANFEEYLNQFNYFKLNAPVHDALVFGMPGKSQSFHLPAWQKLILKSGPEAMLLFGMAPAIETQLQGPPKNLASALEAAEKVKYPKAHEHPSLAKICLQYHIDESIFDQCLAIEARRKKQDNLPNITLDGAEIDIPNYHLVKLPIDDPCAYVLGHITNCCQSIGGDSEACVIDGITRENNGFYVLLKAKDRADQKPSTPLDGKNHIDYRNFEIVGQGYAWLSKQGNLVFDSWENRTPERDDNIIIPMLKKFAQKLTHNTQAEILRVTIGLGGKTPEFYQQNKTYRERMLEGKQYGDSSQQALIYCNEECRNTIICNMKKNIIEIKDLGVSNEFLSNLADWITQNVYSKALAQTIIKEMPKLMNLLLSKKDVELVLKKLNFLDVFELYQAELLGLDAAWNACIKNPKHAKYIIPAYVKLKALAWDQHPDVNQSILRNAQRALHVACAIEKLINLLLQDDKLFQKLLHYLISDVFNRPDIFMDGYTILWKMKLSDDADIKNLIFSFEQSSDILQFARAMQRLREMQLETDPFVRKIIFKKPSLAEENLSFYLKLNYFDASLAHDITIYSRGKLEKEHILSAVEILKEIKLDNNYILRKKLVINPCKIEGVLRCYNYMITQLKLPHDVEILDAMIDTSTFTIGDHLAKALIQLKKLGLENEYDIRQAIIKHKYEYNFIDEISILVESGTISNPIIRNWVLRCDDGYCAELYISAYDKLKEKNLENDATFQEYIFHAIQDKYNHGNYVEYMISDHFVNMINKLKEMKLADNEQVRKHMLYLVDVEDRDNKIADVIEAYSMLITANINITDKMISDIYRLSCCKREKIFANPKKIAEDLISTHIKPIIVEPPKSLISRIFHFFTFENPVPKEMPNQKNSGARDFSNR